ncbi:MAG: oligosaccharide flippase family protein [bacterium]
MLKRLKTLTSSSGAISLFFISGGNIISTIISALALIIFSRFLGPAEFGVFSAGFALMQIIIRVVDMGVNTAAERTIAQKYETSERPTAISYMQLVLWIRSFAITIVLIIGLLFSQSIATWLGITNLLIIRLAFLTSFGTVFYEYVALLLQSTQAFMYVARMAIAQASAKLIFGLILIWQHALTATSALAIYGLMPFFGALSSLRRIPLTSFDLPPNWQKLGKTLGLTARWTAINMIGVTLADNIDILLVQKLLGSYQTGIWGAAGRLALFASLIGLSMTTVLSIRVARYNNKKDLDVYLAKAKWLALGGATLVLLGIPLAGLGLWLTVGPEYLVGTTPLILMLVAVALATSAAPYTALFYLFNRPEYYAYVGIILAVGITVGNWFAIPIYGLIGAGTVKIVVRAAILVFTLFYARSSYLGQVKYSK